MDIESAFEVIGDAPASQHPHSESWEAFEYAMNNPPADMAFFYSLINTSEDAEELREQLLNIEQNIESKLYYELATLVDKFLKVAPFDPIQKIVFFQFVLGHIAERLGPLQFLNSLAYVASQSEPDVALGFLQHLSPKIKKFSDKGAQLFYFCTQAYHYALMENTEASEKLLDVVDHHIETVIDLDLTVYSAYFRAKMELQLVKKKYEELCQSTILYFSYTPLETIPPETKVLYAKRLAIYSMVAQKLYNFGDILQLSPINTDLKGSNYSWLIEFLETFNDGAIVKFKELLQKYKDQLDEVKLSDHLEQMNEKIIISAMMDYAFEKPKSLRLITFERFATHCDIEFDEVEKYLMKAMSLKLLDGKIDGVKQAAEITWIKPRILDYDKLYMMQSRLRIWIDHTVKVLDQINGNVYTELLTSQNP